MDLEKLNKLHSISRWARITRVMRLREAKINSKQAIVGRARLAAQSDWRKCKKVQFESNSERGLLVQAFGLRKA
jgi:hypothetical protein